MLYFKAVGAFIFLLLGACSSVKTPLPDLSRSDKPTLTRAEVQREIELLRKESIVNTQNSSDDNADEHNI